MIDKEEQSKNIDVFMEDLLAVVRAEAIAMGIPMDEQRAAEKAFRALADAAKSIAGDVTVRMFASAAISYGHSLIEAVDADEAPVERGGGRIVTEHINEKLSVGEDEEKK